MQRGLPAERDKNRNSARDLPMVWQNCDLKYDLINDYRQQHLRAPMRPRSRDTKRWRRQQGSGLQQPELAATAGATDPSCAFGSTTVSPFA